MNVPTNSAPSSFVISKSSPFTRPVLRAAHHDIKPSPMTTLLKRIPHVARARNVAPHCPWRSDEVLPDFHIRCHIDILPVCRIVTDHFWRHGRLVAPTRDSLDDAANDPPRSY